MPSYPAIIEKAKNGFGIAFPDFPGCVSLADTEQDIVKTAKEVLESHIELMLEDDLTLPAPSDINTAPRDPEVSEFKRILIDIDIEALKKKL